MSQSDFKKYWFLKLPKDFFKRHDVMVLKSQPNGSLLVVLYLELLCESITHDGELRFNEETPYDEKMLATIFGISQKVLKKNLEILKNFGLFFVKNDGTIVMTEVHKMIGVESGKARRSREYREKMKEGGAQTSPKRAQNEPDSSPFRASFEPDLSPELRYKSKSKSKSIDYLESNKDTLPNKTTNEIDSLKERFSYELAHWDEEDEPDLQIEEEII